MVNHDPARQGAYDGTCGFYSIGNALSLLYQDVEIDRIFFEMFATYIKNNSDSSFLTEGMFRGKLNKILTDTISALGMDDCHVYRPFWNKPASSLNDLWEKLIEHCEGNNSVAILGYEYSRFDESDWYSHWTVIQRATEKTLFTHDSSDELKRIGFSKCRIWDNKSRHKSKPYKLSSTDLFVISRSHNEA